MLLFPGSVLLKPCEFPSDSSTKASFLLMRWLRVDSWIGPGHQKDQPMMNFQPHSSSREGRRIEMKLLTEEACILVKSQAFMELPDGWTPPHQEGDAHQLLGDRAPVLQILSQMSPFSSGCSSVFFIVPFNKLANVFPWFLWAAVAN